MENIELLNLANVSYDLKGLTSLKDVSFKIHKGENLIIFGSEDSGANLVCSVIAELDERFDGYIYYKGKSIREFDYIERHEYRKELGYLQRYYGLINNMNVEQNISLPLEYHSKLSREDIQDIVDSLIRELNLEKCRNLRPVNLLRSEQLKTAYARAIALNPDILLVEHALEDQCLLNAQTFLKNIKKRSFVEGKSIIIVTYEPERFVDFSDRFIMFHNGAIVFSGTRDDFLGLENRHLAQYMNSSTDGPMRIL